jgi:cellulase
MMSKEYRTGALLATLVASVAGHTCVKKFEAGGKTYEGFRQGSKVDPKNQSPAWWTNQGWGLQPIYGDQINSPNIIAHEDASPSPYAAGAPAGEQVTFTWYHEGTCGADEEGWDCSHHGWTTTYMAPCHGDCRNVEKTSLEFFKIHESALIDYRAGRYSQGSKQGQVGYWGTDAIFYDNSNKQSVTIPKEIPSGNYVLRTEVVSIHNNGPVSERQFWPQAFNIKVTDGDDSASMPEGKKGTELYHVNDTLLQWDLYWHDAGKTFESAPGPQLASIASVHRRRARLFFS